MVCGERAVVKKISDYGKDSSPILQDYDHRMHVARKATQLTFTCSKSAIKALYKGVKYVQT